MRIDDRNLTGLSTTQLGNAQQSEAVARSGQRKDFATRLDGSADRWQLSDLSGRLLEMLSVDPPEQAARLERLAADFRAGDYRPDAPAVSRALVEEALSSSSSE